METNVNDLVETVDDLRFCEFDHSDPDPLEYSEDYKNGFNEACSKVVEILYSLSTAPVEVPEFMAEWYEEHKDDLEQAIFDLHVGLYKKSNNELTGFEEWAVLSQNKPIEILIKMKDGYTVAKEPEYVVVIDGLYLGEPINDISNYVEMTWHLEYAYKFKSRNEAKEHTSILGGEVVPVEEEE